MFLILTLRFTRRVIEFKDLSKFIVGKCDLLSFVFSFSIIKDLTKPIIHSWISELDTDRDEWFITEKD